MKAAHTRLRLLLIGHRVRQFHKSLLTWFMLRIRNKTEIFKATSHIFTSLSHDYHYSISNLHLPLLPQSSFESEIHLLKFSLFFFSFLQGDYKKGLRRGKNNLGFYIHKLFQLFYLCLTGLFLPAIISKSHSLLLSVLSWQIKHKRRRISYLLASDTNKFCISTQWNEKTSSCGRLFITFFMHCCRYV